MTKIVCEYCGLDSGDIRAGGTCPAAPADRYKHQHLFQAVSEGPTEPPKGKE